MTHLTPQAVAVQLFKNHAEITLGSIKHAPPATPRCIARGSALSAAGWRRVCGP